MAFPAGPRPPPKVINRITVWPSQRLRSATKDHCDVNLISDALPFGRLWYDGPNAVTNATGYAMHDSRSADAVIRVYNAAGNVIETHAHAGDFREF